MRCLMPKTKAQKAETITAVAERMDRMAGAVLADFTGVKINELEELRRTSRAEHCEYLVVKKTLFQRAAATRGTPVDDASMTGSVSVLFGFADPVTPAKIAKQFAKAHPAMKILGGFIREDAGVRALDGKAVAMLGDLPSRDELRARLVGSLVSPLRGMVGVLQGNLRNLVYVLQAIEKTKA